METWTKCPIVCISIKISLKLWSHGPMESAMIQVIPWHRTADRSSPEPYYLRIGNVIKINSFGGQSSIVSTFKAETKWPPFHRRYFEMPFLEWISIKISLKFPPKCSINNITTLVQIMAWRRPGDMPLPEPKVVCLLTHICVIRPQWVKHANQFTYAIHKSITLI